MNEGRIENEAACSDIGAEPEGLIVWNGTDGDHPARNAARRSFLLVGTGQREAWLDLWSEDAVVQDPVGPSMFDPDGRGHVGKEAIAAFWDASIALVERFRFTIHESFANGPAHAASATFTTWFPDGTRVDTDLVTTHQIDEQGKLCAMRAYWEPERAMATARKE